MLRLLNEVSPWLLALGIVAIAEAYSIGLMLLCRKRWGTDRLALNNEVAGFKFALDYPFTGDVPISRAPFEQSLREMPQQEPPP